MVSFFFSGAWAAAASAAAATSAATMRNKDFMAFLLLRFLESEAHLRRERGVVPQLLGFEREVRGEQVEIDAREDAALGDVLGGERRAVRRSAGAHDARARIRGEDREALGHHRV